MELLKYYEFNNFLGILTSIIFLYFNQTHDNKFQTKLGGLSTKPEKLSMKENGLIPKVIHQRKFILGVLLILKNNLRIFMIFIFKRKKNS